MSQLEKPLKSGNQPDVIVAGVIKNIPDISHLQFNFLFPYRDLDEVLRADWHNTMYYTYILLNKKTNYNYVSEKISDYLKTPTPESTSSLYLQPLKKIHLYSTPLRLPVATAGNILYVNIFTILALFILFIACINFVNLTTARSGNRAKEIGIRKVLGASISGIISLLSKEFVKWVAIANLIAWPVGYFLVKNYFLQNYACKTKIGLEIFIFSTLGSLLIAIFTVSYQSIKASLANPVKTLKYE